jgi:serine/threonine protein kinase
MLRTDITGFYTAPEAMGMSNSSETSEYTNAVDIWSLGCISHKMLTQVMPFSRLCILFEYYERRVEFPRTIMLSKNISTQGIGFVERMLASVPSSRPAAEEALGHEWLLADDEEAMEPDNEVPTDQCLIGRLPPTPAMWVGRSCRTRGGQLEQGLLLMSSQSCVLSCEVMRTSGY